MADFRPIPLLANAHLQTVLGNLFAGRVPTSRAVRRLVPLPDGDAIVLHESPPLADVTPGSPPIALLVHGLGGSHQSGYMRRVTQRLREAGWRVFRMDLRAAGAGLRHARRFYNAACSADVRAVVESLSAAFPQAPVAVVGFSLGGNIVLKYAGELGEQPPPSLRALAVIAPPIELVRCSDLMAGQPFYDAWYVRHLTTQVALHERHFPDVPKIVFPPRLSLRQFDDLYTAPRWGFEDALDYYRKASSLRWIQSIQVPAFILTSRDDPFVAVEPFDAIDRGGPVEVHISSHGGHMGFLGFDGDGGIRWAESRLVNWLIQRIQ
jgi:uncharacterized protein